MQHFLPFVTKWIVRPLTWRYDDGHGREPDHTLHIVSAAFAEKPLLLRSSSCNDSALPIAAKISEWDWVSREQVFFCDELSQVSSITDASTLTGSSSSSSSLSATSSWSNSCWPGLTLLSMSVLSARLRSSRDLFSDGDTTSEFRKVVWSTVNCSVRVGSFQTWESLEYL